jgi:hypothetical protein
MRKTFSRDFLFELSRLDNRWIVGLPDLKRLAIMLYKIKTRGFNGT